MSIKADFELRIKNLLNRIELLEKEDEYEEIISDLSRYLCLLISGYFEKVFKFYLLDYVSKNSNKQIEHYFSNKIKRINNFNMDMVRDTLKNFDENWDKEIKEIPKFSEYKESMDYIYTNRNKIAHGDDTTVVYRDLQIHYDKIRNFLENLEKVFIL